MTESTVLSVYSTRCHGCTWFLILKSSGVWNYKYFLIDDRVFQRLHMSSLVIHLNSSSDFDINWRIPRKYLTSLWIWHLFTTILSNLWLFLKIGEFRTCFSNLGNSYLQSPTRWHSQEVALWTSGWWGFCKEKAYEISSW